MDIADCIVGVHVTLVTSSKQHQDPPVGHSGTIVATEPPEAWGGRLVLVDFDNWHDGHNGNGSEWCSAHTDDRAWWVFPDQLAAKGE
jgi:hypothetical protein